MLNQITIDNFMVTKTPGIIIDYDATGAFDRVINGLALIALRSIGFATSVTRMLGSTWNKRKCFTKTGFGVSDSFYQYMDDKQTFGVGQGSTAAPDIWSIIHGILMHTFTTYFIGIILVSVSDTVQHKRVDEGLIDDTGLAASVQSSTKIPPTRNEDVSPDESALLLKMQNILQFFLELLHVASGDLDIAKCTCFTFFNQWTSGRATLFKI
jgi:hypothetical protein